MKLPEFRQTMATFFIREMGRGADPRLPANRIAIENEGVGDSTNIWARFAVTNTGSTIGIGRANGAGIKQNERTGSALVEVNMPVQDHSYKEMDGYVQKVLDIFETQSVGRDIAIISVIPNDVGLIPDEEVIRTNVSVVFRWYDTK